MLIKYYRISYRLLNYNLHNIFRWLILQYATYLKYLLEY